MKYVLLLFIFTAFAITLKAQPANDECSGAQTLILSSPLDCNDNSTATNTFSGTNIAATTTAPYPAYAACAGGPSPSASSEVWYTFTAVGDETTITVTSGLANPVLILFQGNDCNDLFPVACATGTSINAFTAEGGNYYLMVAGGNTGDQAAFDLHFFSEKYCHLCLDAEEVSWTAEPSDPYGYYAPGQTVEFCFSISQWENNGSRKLHGITFEMGSGWDPSTLTPSNFGPNDSYGYWDFYPFWTGCHSGDNFGPGFAFESTASAHPTCTTGILDSDPGNNYGMIVQNANDPPSPFVFCWQITVNPAASQGADLSLNVIVSSDTDSGSWWNGVSCYPDGFPLFTSLGTVNDCGSTTVDVISADLTCPGANDGSFSVSTSQNLNLTIYNPNGNQMGSCNNCNFYNQNNLAPGTYTITAINPSTGCNYSAFANIGTSPIEAITLEQLNLPCLGENVLFEAQYQGSQSVIYEWTGPGGTSYTGQTISVNTPGTYEVIANLGSCSSAPYSIETEYVNFTPQILTNISEVCEGDEITLSANDGVSWIWTNLNTGTDIGTGENLTYTFFENTDIELTATDDNGCSETDQITITVNPSPEITINVDGNGCANTETTLTASGALTYSWDDDPTAGNPRTLSNLSSGYHTFIVNGTDGNGCVGTGIIEVEIFPTPEVTLQVSPEEVCQGEEVTVFIDGNDWTNIFWGDNIGPVNTPSVTLTPTTDLVVSAEITNSSGCIETFYNNIIVNESSQPVEVMCSNITPNSIDFTWNDMASVDGYEVIINGGTPTMVAVPEIQVNNLSPDTDVEIIVTPTGNITCPQSDTIICTTLSCTGISLDIDPVEDICQYDTLAAFPLTFIASVPGIAYWEGNGIIDVDNGIFHPDSAGTGIHEIILSYTIDECIYRDTTSITVFSVPTAEFSLDTNLICLTDTVQLMYTGTAGNEGIFNWNFGNSAEQIDSLNETYLLHWDMAGPDTISLSVSENGCFSDTLLQTITIEEPLSVPVIDCLNQAIDSLTFSWSNIPEAIDYTWSIDNGPAVTTTDTFVNVNGLMPETDVLISLTINTDHPCGPVTSEQTCSTLPCPQVSIDIQELSDQCLDENTPVLTLAADVIGGTSEGTLTWSGAMGINGNSFDPEEAGIGEHIIIATYTDGFCSYTAQDTINIFAIPTSDFSLSTDSICLSEAVTVTYTGTASPSAEFNWSFDNGIAAPGDGVGPHQVNWPTEGQQIISLTVTDNGCTGATFQDTITVLPGVYAPEVDCNSTTSTIVFSWEEVPGAIGYTPSIISAPSYASTEFDEIALTFTISDLNPEDEVEISLTIHSSGQCPDVTTSQICNALECPTVEIMLDEVDPICLDNSSSPITLFANITGGSGNGAHQWTGTGITDTIAGTFDPSIAGAGTWNIEYNYSEENCNYSATADIVVNDTPPTASFDVSIDTLCMDSSLVVTYTGTADSSATFNWDFGTGSAFPGTGTGPHNVSWSTSGPDTIRLSIFENGCTSELYEVPVFIESPIEAPEISCMPDYDAVTFTWEAVSGANDYDIVVIDAPVYALTEYDPNNLTFTVSNLNFGDPVTIMVSALTGNSCGISNSISSCEALTCEQLNFVPTAFGPFCEDESPQQLQASIDGGNDGTYTWIGTGIDSSGHFDPSASGTGSIDLSLTYTEGICIYDTSFSVMVLPTPEASFNAPSVHCMDDIMTLAFNGQASSEATYEWDFDNAIVLTGSEAGPYELSWPASGTTAITLIVDDGGCTDTLIHEIQIDAPLAAPVINCEETTLSSILFSWESVPGANTYAIEVLTGQSGTQNGNSFLVEGLAEGESVTIEVTAIGDSVCGNSSAEMTCTTITCEPVNLSLIGDESVCIGYPATVSFNFDTPLVGPFLVDYRINNDTVTMVSIGIGQFLNFDNLQTETTIEILNIINPDQPACNITSGQIWTISVEDPAEAGEPPLGLSYCTNTEDIVDLDAQLIGADTGGTWVESSEVPSMGGAFDPASATFIPAGQAPQTYAFTYTVSGNVCPDDAVTLEITLLETPVADAGDDTSLDCVTGEAPIGGNGTTPGIMYSWYSDNASAIIEDPVSAITSTNQPGQYTLIVINNSGCMDSDIVNISEPTSIPEMTISSENVTCFGENNGIINIDDVAGGMPPYTFSLNGNPGVLDTAFQNLGAGEYLLLTEDANGCAASQTIIITEPDSLYVLLTGDFDNDQNIITLGQSLTITATFTPSAGISQMIWDPEELNNATVLNPVIVTPQSNTTYVLNIIDEAGCEAAASLQVNVAARRNLYFPTAFSPNGDGINDLFFAGAGPGVESISRFEIYSRWGELLFIQKGVLPNDPSAGWNGTQKGKLLNSGVFIYLAEVEFIDGKTEVFSGEVLLMR